MARRPITRSRPWTPTRGPFAGRTFTTEREYRNALAREKGHRNWLDQQRATRTVRSRDDLARLHPSEREARRAALDALNYIRNDRLSLGEAAERAGTTPAAVHRHVGTALERQGGRYVAKPADRLLRVMTVLGPRGLEHEVEVRGSRAASRIGAHWSAIDHYLRTGDDSRLRRLAGNSVARIPLEIDLDAIDDWERRGVLDIEDVYELVA
jgi:hypothetical protein